MDQSKLADVCELTLVLYTIILIISGLGCLGNVLAFIGFQRERKKSPTTFLFQCLAVADTTFLLSFSSCLCTDAMLQCVGDSYSRYYRCHKQAYVFYLCDPLMYMAHLTSVWITVLLGIIRFTAVCYPLHFTKTFTLAKVKRICVIALVFFAIFELFWLAVRKVEETDIVDLYNNDTCVALVNRNDVAESVYILGFTLVIHYLIPLTTLTFVTFKIIFALRARSSNTGAQSRSQRQAKSITRILVVILMILFICNTFHLVQMALFLKKVYGNIAGHVVFFISRSLLVINSGINVIVYVTVSKDYRRMMLAQLCSGSRYSDNDNSTSVSRATSCAQLSVNVVVKL